MQKQNKKHFGWIYSGAPQRRKHFKLCGMGIVHPAVPFAAFFQDRSGMEDGSGKITPANLPAPLRAQKIPQKNRTYRIASPKPRSFVMSES